MANLEFFETPELYKKYSGLKYFLKIEISNSISSMGYKKVLSKTIISVGKNWLNKKPHVTKILLKQLTKSSKRMNNLF